MSFKMKSVRFAVATSIAATTIAGVSVGTAESASALACYDQLSSYKVHNRCAPYVRHWNTFRSGPTKYAAWATKYNWSAQPVCWVGFTSRGATIRYS